MLAKGTTMGGVVYHPYGNGAGFIPESTYEWQWRDFGSWIQARVSNTSLPKWETEWGIGTNATFTNTTQAEFIPRRLLQESVLRVEHSLLSEFHRHNSSHY